MLGYWWCSEDDGMQPRRKPQPSAWSKILCERDGKESGASVTIFRATQAERGTILDPNKREIFQQTCSSEELESYGLVEDESLMSSDEKGKELLVVVRRGAHVDIAERDGPPYSIENDIRRWLDGMTWEMQREHVFGDFYESRKVVEDEYEDVDHNVWEDFAKRGIAKTWKGSSC